MTLNAAGVISFWLFVALFLSPKSVVSSLVVVVPSPLGTRHNDWFSSITTSTRVLLKAFTENKNENESILLENVSILFESDRVLAIDKPPGIAHHDGNNDNDLGILSLLRNAQSNRNLLYQGRLYGVHRLDRVTSGILLFAKDAEMASILTRAFRNGNVTKYYVGVSSRKRLKKKQGWIKGNMVRGRRKSWYLSNREKKQESSSSNNTAVTRFFTASLSSLRESAVDTDAPPMACILFRPYTGRTHQLRVAAKSVGLPLSGDSIYTDGLYHSISARTCLHASAIHIDLGDNEDSITIWSPPSFHHLYKDDSKGNKVLSATVMQLMKKHCDCDEILAAISTASNSET